MGSIKKTHIDAILGEEFYKLLGRLGVKEDFESGRYRCQICGDQVDVNNILIVFPLSENEVGFVCRKPKCLAEYKLSMGK